MKTLKKFVASILVIALSISIVACNNTNSSNSSESTAKKLTIGVIQYATHPSLDNCYNGLVEGLKSAGYIDGDNITIDFKNAQGDSATSDQIANNMVASNYDMIIGIATPSAMSAYGAAKGEIPVIFCAVSDPVSAKLVNSLELSGVNCTGSSDKLNLKAQLEMIRAFQPDAKTIGIIYNTAEANSLSQLNTIKELAPEYGFEIIASGIQAAADIPTTATSLADKVDCINNFTDNLVVDNLQVVIERATAAGIPVYGSEIEQVNNGCLASESLDYVDLGKQTGTLAAEILGGKNAAETSVVVVDSSFPVYNSDVASSLGITVPDSYLNAEVVTNTTTK